MQPLFRYSIIATVVVLPLCFLTGSCSPPDEPGEVDVSGCIVVPPQFFLSWQQGQQLAIVARDKSSRTMKAHYQVSKSDTTCYKHPESCPSDGTLSGLNDGKYLILLESHDPAFTSSKGKNGTATAVGYYQAPANKTGPGGLVFDINQATVIEIDAKHKKHSITFGAP